MHTFTAGALAIVCCVTQYDMPLLTLLYNFCAAGHCNKWACAHKLTLCKRYRWTLKASASVCMLSSDTSTHVSQHKGAGMFTAECHHNSHKTAQDTTLAALTWTVCWADHLLTNRQGRTATITMTAMMMRSTMRPQHIHLRVDFWYVLAFTSSFTPDSTWSRALPTCQCGRQA